MRRRRDVVFAVVGWAVAGLGWLACLASVFASLPAYLLAVAVPAAGFAVFCAVTRHWLPAYLGLAGMLGWALSLWPPYLRLLVRQVLSRLAEGSRPPFLPPGGEVAPYLVLAVLPAGAVAAGLVLFGRAAFPRVGPGPSVVLCRTRAGFPVVIPAEDRFVHTLVVGPTMCGKSTQIKGMVGQDLRRMAWGERLGLTVVEPKGDLVREVAEMARDMGIPVVLIDPEDPGSPRFNPLQGDPHLVADIMRTVLKAMFGRQEAFFSHVQETSARNTVQLLKILEQHDRDLALAQGERPPVLTMLDLARVLRNTDLLKSRVDALKRVAPESDLVEYFDREVFGQTGAKLHEFAMGLRMQLEDIVGSPILARVLNGPSDVDLDRHLAEGGQVLCVNTCFGSLGRLGDLFGQFVVLHFQQAVFRRPPEGVAPRIPHFLYLDEFPRYLNPDFERMVAMARSYRCAAILAIQVTDQLLLAEAPAFREVVLQNCRNKLVFGGLSASDAERFAREFGEQDVRVREMSYRHHRTVLMPWGPDQFRESWRPKPRFAYTQLMELPRFHVAYRLVCGGTPQPPGLGVALPPPRRVARPRRAAPAPAVPAGQPAASPGAPAPAPCTAADDDFF